MLSFKSPSVKKIVIFSLMCITILFSASCNQKDDQNNSSAKKSGLSKTESSSVTSQTETSSQEDESSYASESENPQSEAEQTGGNTTVSKPDSATNNNNTPAVNLRSPRKIEKETIVTYDPKTIDKTLYVKDFGAKGDGKTDDGEAIFDALVALQKIGKNARLIFEKNKTYIYNFEDMRSSYRYMIKIDNCVNVHIEGDNTTIISASKRPREFLTLTNTVGCSVSGLNFDFEIRPYFMAQNATEIDTTNLTCVMEIGSGMAEKYLGLTQIGEKVTFGVNGNNGNPFGIIEENVSRKHMYLNQYELVGTDKIKIYFIKGANTNTASWLSQLTSNRLICPTPNVGHAIEYATYFNSNIDFTVQNVNIYNSCRFAAAVSNNSGKCTFNNMNFIPNPALNGTFEETDFTSWRDGWHLKENRAKFVWNNCTATGMQDDIFNISSSVMWIKEVQAANRINMYWSETGGAFRQLKKGDVISIHNTQTGELLATTSISRVIKQAGSDNIVTLTDSFANLPSGSHIEVTFDTLVANGSEIKNCAFNGTFRFRGPITITNTTFINRRMWLDIYAGSNGWVEGPVPNNIIFKDCVIACENTTSAFIHASAYNNNVAKTAYHLKNIVFENCVVNERNFEIGPGDEVIFKNCRTQ